MKEGSAGGEGRDARLWDWVERMWGTLLVWMPSRCCAAAEGLGPTALGVDACSMIYVAPSTVDKDASTAARAALEARTLSQSVLKLCIRRSKRGCRRQTVGALFVGRRSQNDFPSASGAR